MTIDRQKFYTTVRRRLSKKLTPEQVMGFNIILDEWESTGMTDKRWLAYMLATIWHETATRMEPVIETRRANEVTNPSVDTAITRLEASWKAGKLPWVTEPYWRKDDKGLSWLGRGPVQYTHRVNYAKAEEGLGIKFTENPDLMLQTGPAIKATFYGMTKGIFTGKSLGTYFSAKKDDPLNARKVINGLESADKVKSYYLGFIDALS